MRVYGRWAGDPRGKPEDTRRCIVEVMDNVSWLSHQCQRRRGHGTNGLFCKQHAARFPTTESICIPEDEGD